MIGVPRPGPSRRRHGRASRPPSSAATMRRFRDLEEKYSSYSQFVGAALDRAETDFAGVLDSASGQYETLKAETARMQKELQNILAAEGVSLATDSPGRSYSARGIRQRPQTSSKRFRRRVGPRSDRPHTAPAPPPKPSPPSKKAPNGIVIPKIELGKLRAGAKGRSARSKTSMGSSRQKTFSRRRRPHTVREYERSRLSQRSEHIQEVADQLYGSDSDWVPIYRLRQPSAHLELPVALTLFRLCSNHARSTVFTWPYLYHLVSHTLKFAYLFIDPVLDDSGEVICVEWNRDNVLDYRRGYTDFFAEKRVSSSVFKSPFWKLEVQAGASDESVNEMIRNLLCNGELEEILDVYFHSLCSEPTSSSSKLAPRISRDTYFSFYHKIHTLLVPEINVDPPKGVELCGDSALVVGAYNPDEQSRIIDFAPPEDDPTVVRKIAFDWACETDGALYVSRNRFHLGLFLLVHSCTNTLDVEQYLSFLRQLFPVLFLEDNGRVILRAHVSPMYWTTRPALRLLKAMIKQIPAPRLDPVGSETARPLRAGFKPTDELVSSSRRIRRPFTSRTVSRHSTTPEPPSPPRPHSPRKPTKLVSSSELRFVASPRVNPRKVLLSRPSTARDTSRGASDTHLKLQAAARRKVLRHKPQYQKEYAAKMYRPLNPVVDKSVLERRYHSLRDRSLRYKISRLNENSTTKTKYFGRGYGSKGSDSPPPVIQDPAPPPDDLFVGGLDPQIAAKIFEETSAERAILAEQRAKQIEQSATEAAEARRTLQFDPPERKDTNHPSSLRKHPDERVEEWQTMLSGFEEV